MPRNLQHCSLVLKWMLTLEILEWSLDVVGRNQSLVESQGSDDTSNGDQGSHDGYEVWRVGNQLCLGFGNRGQHYIEVSTYM